MLRIVVCCAVLAAATARADPGFQLGIGYTEDLGFLGENPVYSGVGQGVAIASDGSNSSYFLGYTIDVNQLPHPTILAPPNPTASFILKQAPDGQTISYVTVLGFQASAMAVDSAGSAFVAGPEFVAKLNTAGTAFVSTFNIGAGLVVTSLAVDQKDRLYVTGYTVSGAIPPTPGAFHSTNPNNASQHTFVLRLNAVGDAIEYRAYLAGNSEDLAWGIAVDASGSAIIAGMTYSTNFPTTPGAYSSAGDPVAGVGFLARFTADGSSLIYSTLLGGAGARSIVGPAVDKDGNAVVGIGADPQFMQRFDATGALNFSRVIPGVAGLATDAAGNIYVSGSAISSGYPVRNSVVTCQPESAGRYPGYVAVFDPSGDLLQSTFLPLGQSLPTGLALGPATVYVLTDHGNESQAGYSITQLAPDPAAQPVSLACMGNAASFDPGPVSAGELVSLLGQGLGPAEGVVPHVDLKSGFPSRLSNVQVTFNGNPSPLMYVQDTQINTIVPWSIAGASTVEICVSYSGAVTNCLRRSVAVTTPGVFTTDGYHAAALNQDGTINSPANPAAPDSVVSVFATGLGPVSPQLNDGAIAHPPLGTNTISTQVGVQAFSSFFGTVIDALPLKYAGPAPYQVAGVSQINFSVSGYSAFWLASSFFEIYVAN